jgi:ribonuclease R
VETEREITSLKTVEYMKQFVGDTFTGEVCGVTSFGVFVALENTAEGLIRLGDMRDDYYEFLPDRLSITGTHTKRKFTIGMKVNVVVVRANPDARQIDFLPEDLVYRKGNGEKNRIVGTGNGGASRIKLKSRTKRKKSTVSGVKKRPQKHIRKK